VLRFHSDDLWERITKLSLGKNGPISAAVPFLGVGAAKQLPLQRGDTLITRFDDGAIEAGLVHPGEVVKYIKRGVEVHSVANLHAKVFVFRGRAIVGSANVSNTSATALVEAACETSDRQFVSACLQFVNGLRGDTVELSYARKKIKLYRPPKDYTGMGRAKSQRKPVHSPLCLMKLESVDFDELDNEATSVGQSTAESRLQDVDCFAVETIRWRGALPSYVRPGSRVLCVSQEGRALLVEPPARVLHIQHYKSSRGATRSIIFVERRKRLRAKTWATIVKLIPETSSLKSVSGTREIRNQNLVRMLGQLWPYIA
jgi:hypothetical protein